MRYKQAPRAQSISNDGQYAFGACGNADVPRLPSGPSALLCRERENTCCRNSAMYANIQAERPQHHNLYREPSVGYREASDPPRERGHHVVACHFLPLVPIKLNLGNRVFTLPALLRSYLTQPATATFPASPSIAPPLTESVCRLGTDCTDSESCICRSLPK